MVSVDAVLRGKECDCFCESCDAPLIARKGEKNQHHFAHFVEAENCVAARETSIHKFAKQLICEQRELRLPDDIDLGAMRSASGEQWLDGIRPDVVAEFAEEQVAVEIYVAHKVPAEKIKTLIVRKLATLEIDLSFNRHRCEEEWRELVLRTAPRFWLVPPAVVRKEIERRAREAAEAAAERAAVIEERARQQDWEREWRERRDRAERDFQQAVSAEARRRHLEKSLEKAKQDNGYARNHEVMVAGLKRCVDTEWHFAELAKRKAAARGSLS